MNWYQINQFLSRLRLHRERVSFVADALVVALCWHLTYLFRLGFERWATSRPNYDWLVLVGVVGVYLIAFKVYGTARGMWRFTGFAEVKRLTWACLTAGALCAIAVLMAQLTKVPRAVLALHPILTLMGLCLVRITYRMIYEHGRARWALPGGEVRQALILGAGEAAKRLLATIHQQGWMVMGLLDDDPVKQGARVGGVTVLGDLARIQDPTVYESATHIIVALPGATSVQRRRAIELAASTGRPVLTVPSSSELQSGQVQIERIRAIEARDLLGREPVQLDEAGISDLLAGKTVLLTGAGGSIGSELCRQVARYGPARLILLELSEFALYQIEQLLSEQHPHLPLVRLIGDVKDLGLMHRIMQGYRPHWVFHAAAFKHVPLMEEDNAAAALLNNTLGTYHAAVAAAQAQVERFVLISTDKAVNPTNVMGASKRAAEMVLSYLAGRSEFRATQFSAVRFGNVLGSSGSVIPKFKEQIAKGGPITVTHPEITRYFMTIPEAARLVLQAAALAQTGQVYVLDMGEPVNIVDLARNLIRLSGHKEGEIPIIFTGLRPGEKLYEELLADNDQTLASKHPRLRIANLQGHSTDQWAQTLLQWLIALKETPLYPRELRLQLARWVPEYQPQDRNLLDTES